MSHQYKAEAKASHDRKLRSYGGNTSSTVDKANKDGDATNFAGFPALNTSKQAGMAPLSDKSSMSKETMSRIMRKAGGKVFGATSLKRLDKAPRKGKAAGGGLQGTGQRVGPIPSADTQQMDFDPTTRVKPGEMTPGTMRRKGGKVQDYESRSHESQGAQGKRPFEGHKKGGRIKKAGGGGFEDILGSIGNALFGEEEAAPSRGEAAGSARGMGRHAARHPVVRHRVTETEHPADVPLPPRRPAQFTGPEGAVMSAGAPANPRAALGRPDEGGMRSFLDSQLYGNEPVASGWEIIPSRQDRGMPDEGGMRGFYDSQLSPTQPRASTDFLTQQLYGRKNGGRLGRASGGKSEHPDEAQDKALIRKMVKKEDLKMKDGGRAHRAKGGKTTVNILMGQPQQQGINPMALAALADMAGGPQGGPPQQLPPPGAGAPPLGAGPAPAMMPPPPAAPPGPPPGGPPMPRARGGRTFADIKVSKPKIKDGYPALTGGSGGGKGRREKILAYGDEQK